MLLRPFAALALFALAACGAPEQGVQGAPGEATLEAPAPDSEASRAFAPVGEPASRVTGALSVSVAQNFPDAGSAAAGPREIMKLAGAGGYALEAELVGAAPPSVMIEGQTLRGAMGLPVEATGALIYRVLSERRGEAAGGLCGETTPGHVLVWEPEIVGEPLFKIMGLIGGAPGEGGVRLCPVHDYRRG